MICVSKESTMHFSFFFCLVIFEDLCNGFNIFQAQDGGLHIITMLFFNISIWLKRRIQSCQPSSITAKFDFIRSISSTRQNLLSASYSWWCRNWCSLLNSHLSNIYGEIWGKVGETTVIRLEIKIWETLSSRSVLKLIKRPLFHTSDLSRLSMKKRSPSNNSSLILNRNFT